MMVPFARLRDLLDTIPGIGPMAAAAIIAEIGTASGEQFATAAGTTEPRTSGRRGFRCRGKFIAEQHAQSADVRDGDRSCGPGELSPWQ